MNDSTENIVKETPTHCMDIHNGAEEKTESEADKRNLKKRRDSWIKFALKLIVIGLIWAHFGWATYYFVHNSKQAFGDTTRNGYALLTILFIFINFGILYSLVLGPYVLPALKKTLWNPSVRTVNQTSLMRNHHEKIRKWFVIVFNLLILVGILVFLIVDTADERNRLMPLAGLGFYMLLGFGLSANRRAIPWNTVLSGMSLQFIFGLLTIKWDTGRNIFDALGDKVNVFLGYAVGGSAFVYSDFLVYDKGVFAFKALSTIYFLGFMINILYYYGIMQKVVAALGKFLAWVMNTSICESVNSAANIFLGMSEAPLLLKPYLIHLTDSEIHSVMTSGFATVSGTVLAAYISFGANPAHLITASVMSAPAALCYSKLMYPETEEIQATEENIKQVKVCVFSEYDSVLDAAAKGAHDAYNIVVGIISSLVAFIAFIYFVNGVLTWLGNQVGFTEDYEIWTVDLILGKVFTPVSYIMGVKWEDCEKVGQLIGIKTMVNEFAAFQKMSSMELSSRSKVIATYSICGFSNPGSIGIMISALGALIPSKRETITRLVFRAFVGGAVVCFMTACIAGLLIPEGSEI